MIPHAARRLGGRRSAERRREWVELASYGLDDHDRALLSHLARTLRGPNGRYWLYGLTPDRGRERFNEWVEQNFEEWVHYRAECDELPSDSELQASQAAYYAERMGLDEVPF